jgi:Retroviral aspartyl protease
LDIIAMIDSDSTHSFIHPSIIHLLNLSTIHFPLISITTASGVKLDTDQLYTKLKFQLQQHQFTSDLYVLSIACHDVILGMDWLAGS